MEYDDRLIEEAVLALLAAFSSDTGNAWKGFDFEVMNRGMNKVSSAIR
ncbi:MULTISPECIES: hypothetical protein [Pseudomonas]|jgi:hypothetical protein|nr:MULTISPECIES: hypothetical protein [Pseudomonas]